MQTISPPTAEELNALFIKACEDHQNSNYGEALEGYQKLIQHFPDAPILNYNLGLLLFETKDYKEAKEAFERAIQGSPDDADIVFNLGLTYRKTGCLDRAIEQYKKVLELEPEGIDAMYNLAGCYRDSKEYDLAVATYESLLERKKDHLSANNNLAYVYQLLGDTEKALFFYRKVLELDPDHIAAGYMLAALTGAEISSPPKGYVREIFDNYSDRFEKSLLIDLEYAVPEKIREIVEEGESWKKSFVYGLDLGCGTGLGAESFTPVVESLDGVDLAPKMIEIAESKGVYNSLHISGINDFLIKNVGPYDLVLAADVFGYVGELYETFLQLQERTTADALFCFSTEQTSAEGYKLRPTGRFAHSIEYVEQMAAKTGWKVAQRHACPLRKERGQWIEGNLWFMQKCPL